MGADNNTLKFLKDIENFLKKLQFPILSGIIFWILISILFLNWIIFAHLFIEDLEFVKEITHLLFFPLGLFLYCLFLMVILQLGIWLISFKKNKSNKRKEEFIKLIRESIQEETNKKNGISRRRGRITKKN